MESDLGHVVEISVRDEEESKTTPANPHFRFRHYFTLLFFLACLSATVLVAVKPMSEEDHPFKAHGGFYTIITIASLSVAVLTSGVLIFTSCYFQSCMMDIHYNILKTIGCSSATLALVCLLALIYVPHNLSNWIASSVMSLLFIGFLVAYYFFFWKGIPPDDKPVHPSAFVLFLQPLSLASLAFVPPGDPPIIKYSLLCLWFIIPVAYGCYVVVHDLYLIGENKVCNLKDKTITHP